MPAAHPQRAHITRSGDYGVVFAAQGVWHVMERRDLGWVVSATGSGVSVLQMTSNGVGRKLTPYGERAIDVIRAVRRVDQRARTGITDPRYALPGERTPGTPQPSGTPRGPKAPDKPKPPRNKVTVDGVTYHRLTDDVWADVPYSIRVQVGRSMTPEEARNLAGLVGYAYAKTGGERGNGFSQDSPNSIVFYCDTTKGRAYRRLDEFFDDARTMIVEGSPPRKTKGGTRLIPGMGDVGGIEFYADSVGGN